MISRAEGEALAAEMGAAGFLEASARAGGEGVEAVFEAAMEAALKQHKQTARRAARREANKAAGGGAAKPSAVVASKKPSAVDDEANLSSKLSALTAQTIDMSVAAMELAQRQLLVLAEDVKRQEERQKEEAAAASVAAKSVEAAKPAAATAAAPTAASSSSSSGKYADPSVKKYALSELTSSARPSDVDPAQRESYLSDAEFASLFKTDRATFLNLPEWKRKQQKSAHGLF